MGSIGKSKTPLAFESDDLVVVDSDPNDTKRLATLIPVVVSKKEDDGSWTGLLLTNFLIFIGEPKQDRVLEEAYFPGVEVIWVK